MSRSPRTRLIGILATGILVGACVVLVAGPVHPPDREGRLVVDASYLRSVRQAQTEVRGRPPDPQELARALEERIDSDVLTREAAVRGLIPGREGSGAETSEGPTPSPVRHLQRVAATRWLTGPPSEAEVIAFVEFRRERYGELVASERRLPGAGEPEWESDPSLARLLARARADARTAERLASTNQFLAEIAPRHPIALSRGARAVFGAGVGSGAIPSGSDAGAGGLRAADGTVGEPSWRPPTGEVLAWPIDPEDSWSGAFSVFLEETGEGHYDLTVLLPPGTEDDAVSLSTVCGPGEERTLIPVFAADQSLPDGSWRVARGGLQCPAGTMLSDERLQVSAPAGVRGDLELRRLDGSTYVSDFGGGGGAIGLDDFKGVVSAGPAQKALRGLLDVLAVPTLWMLGLALGSVGLGAGALGAGALGWGLVGFGGGYGLGRWTAGTGGPTTAFGVAEILTLLAVSTLALVWAASQRRAVAARALGPPVVLFALLGLLFGGNAAPALDVALTRVAGWIEGGGGLAVSLAGGAGAALALAPMIAAGVGLASLPGLRRRSPAGSRPPEMPGPLLGWVLGVPGVAGIVILGYASSVVFPPQLSGAQLHVLVFAAAIGVILALAGVRVTAGALASAGLLVVVGLALPAVDDLGGYPATFTSGTIVAACLFAAGLIGLGGALGDGSGWRGRGLLGVGAVGGLAVGLHLSGGAPSGAAASSSALGSAAAALTLGWLAAQAAGSMPEAHRPGALRVASLAAIVLAVLIRLPDYLGPLAESVRGDMAFGRLPVPFLALALAVIALVLRPRRRRVAEALGVRGRTRGLYRWYAAGAFLLLPFGVFYVPIPLQAGGIPAEADANRIVGQLLSDTYEAFDLTNEEALYDRLAETVTGDLLPTLFLENRRGLASGAGDVDEVSVLDVVVAPGGAVSEASGPGRAFAWTGEWAVRARVAHLVHVHLRENLYTGRVVVRADSEGWKMDAVELTAEERVARPWEGR